MPATPLHVCLSEHTQRTEEKRSEMSHNQNQPSLLSREGIWPMKILLLQPLLLALLSVLIHQFLLLVAGHVFVLLKFHGKLALSLRD